MILQRYKIYKNYKYYYQKILFNRTFSVATQTETNNEITLLGHKYLTDNWTNINENIISKLGRNLHISPYHPLSYIRQHIINYFYIHFHNRIGNPIFSVYDNISPVVTVTQNFDSLLVSKDHPSRKQSECYYINQDTLLRAHTTAHQTEFISMGLNNFLIIGDVYRKDEIDSTHYPVFHQADAVRLCTAEEVFHNVNDSEGLKLFEHKGVESNEKQACHTLESIKIMEYELKNTLTGLAKSLFGSEIQCKWVEQYFPFTHPSWELEIYYKDQWLEILGCGIMRQEILQKSGAGECIGWAFGLGLERLAMCLYDIPDIRLFWSKDSGFLNQFKVEDPNMTIKFKPISIYPQCKNDISFWLPENKSYSSKNFYDLVRDIGGDRIEQVILKDEFFHPKIKKLSHCYTIIYRDMERTLSKREVNNIHNEIGKKAAEKLDVTIRS
ncbi:probable phenylalanine--tRNA ligase, mitochondrial [Apis mellifera]|uniref:Phenylalanine--tRNA ligase, mitochondrial n=1 Tax=Apis mellifera TaxID=7460 RepID=A0A7M7GW29_APIME|nr:probable phenylalanine--tRNA ligase, mitochondrial [Apis mellifera]|eukprot:XP_006567240.1 probable phenylalanine--tRNA ligase, mitochondrial [Apis mellifera]